MCRDPGDPTSLVSCCDEPSLYLKNSDFDASAKGPVALPLKISLTENETTVNGKKKTSKLYSSRVQQMYIGVSYLVSCRSSRTVWSQYHFT